MIETKAPFEKYLDIKILARENGYAKLSMPFKKELTNPYGILHGGAILSLADTTMAQAMYSRYSDQTFYTVRLCMDFKAPVACGEVLAEATLLGEKKNFVKGKIVLIDPQGRLIAEGEAVFCLIKKKSS